LEVVGSKKVLAWLAVWNAIGSSRLVLLPEHNAGSIQLDRMFETQKLEHNADSIQLDGIFETCDVARKQRSLRESCDHSQRHCLDTATKRF
jgi:hypothetical protein